MLKTAAALLAITAITAAPAVAAHRPFLTITRAKRAVATEGHTASRCHRDKRTVVTCRDEWEGFTEPEPGSGTHSWVLASAFLCRHRVYVVPGVDPAATLPSCRQVIRLQHQSPELEAS